MITWILKILLAFISMDFCVSWRSFHFRFDSTECHRHNNMTDFLDCSIDRLKRNQEAFNLNMRFNVDLLKPKLDFAIINERPDERDFVLVNFTNVDGCLFLQQKNTFNILQVIRKEFEKYANLPKQCPVTKGTEINVKQLILDANNFPPYVPETDFRVLVHMKENMEVIFTLVVRGRVESRKRLVNKKSLKT